MSWIDNAANVVRLLISGVATVGSVIVHHDPETGKDSINLVPALLWGYSLTTVGCALSQGEPFSQCVSSVISLFGGL